ncbi:27292_t:CDS:1, partial [Racocetra persica]
MVLELQLVKMNQKIGDDCSANNPHVGNLLEERLRRYENEAGQINSTSALIDRVSYLRKNRENDVSKAIINIEDSMNVDLCFVLDCTSSMSDHIEAAKEHILKVASYIDSNNSNIEFWVGFCGYRDHSD